MKLKKLLTHVAGLTLSFNVFAAGVQDKSVFYAPQQAQPIVQASFNQQSYNPRLNRVNSNKQEEIEMNTENELVTELGVYLLIIAIYSFYGLKVNAKKIDD